MLQIEAEKLHQQYPPATEPTQQDGWLSPQGVYYPVDHHGHYRFAEAIGEHTTIYMLEDEGWVHISDERIRSYDGMLKFTQAQRDVLFDMMMVNPTSYLGRDLQYWLKPQQEDEY